MQGPGQPEQVLDTDLLSRLADDLGDAELVAEMLGMFDEELDERLGVIDSAVAGGDPAEVRRAAHGLASPSATLGLVGLCEACRVLERDPGTAQADRLVARIREVAGQTRAAVAEYAARLVAG